jgi:predicted extracellular nuclease
MQRTMTIALALTMIAIGSGACRSTEKNNSDGFISWTEAGVQEGGPATGATIYDVNSGKVAEKTKVRIAEVVVTAVDSYANTYAGDVWVQELKGGQGSGIKLYQPVRTDSGRVSDLKPGDHVRVEGTVKYFAPSTPFNDSDHPNKKYIIELDKGCQITYLTTKDPPVPAEVTVADLTTDPTAQGWEHVLVVVKNVGVTRPVTDPKYGEFQVTGGLPVDDEFYAFTSPNIGDCLSVTGISSYFYDYKLLPRDQADLGTGTGCPPPPPKVTIKDLQDASSASHPAKGTMVTVTGVVSAVDSRLDTSHDPPEYLGFWIQEEGAAAPRSGIYVYYYWFESTAASMKPQLNDIVELTGTYDEYKYSKSTRPDTLPQLTKVYFVKKGTSSNLPQPATIADPSTIATDGSKTRDYLGVLVKVENVEVDSIVTTTGTTKTPVGIKLKTSGLIVENELFNFMADPAPGPGKKYLAISGVLHYSFDNYKILPRSSADMVPQ